MLCWRDYILSFCSIAGFTVILTVALSFALVTKQGLSGLDAKGTTITLPSSDQTETMVSTDHNIADFLCHYHFYFKIISF